MITLCMDYGEKRLGFALSDPAGLVAVPVEVVEVGGDAEARKKALELCERTEAELLVIGVPYNMNGSSGGQALKVLEFVETLRPLLEIPVDTWDERMSTMCAERSLLEQDVSRAKRKRVRDKLAAQSILQSYLDSKSADMEPNV